MMRIKAFGWAFFFRAVRVEDATKCPRCGGEMVKREPREGQLWAAFWGCRSFPYCTGARNLEGRETRGRRRAVLPPVWG